jgi:hypothetical protein
VSFAQSQNSSDWELIGNQQVQMLENGSNPFQNNQYTYTVPFTLPLTNAPAPSAALFSAVWDDVNGSQSISVMAPDGTTFTPGSSQILNNITIHGTATTAANTPPGQKSLTLQVAAENAFSTLPTGTYKVNITSDGPLSLPVTALNSQWTSTYSYSQPTAQILGLPSSAMTTLDVPLQGQVQSGLESQATFTVFVDDDAEGHNGVPLQTNVAYGSGTPTASVDVSKLPNGVYYFYDSIDDGFNPTVYSAYSDSVLVVSPLSGQVTNAMTPTALSGITVWIDNPTLPPNGVYDPGTDYSTVTDALGQYSFAGPLPNASFQDGTTYTVGIVVGPGFQATSGSANQNFIYGTGPGETTTASLNFTLDEYTFLSGVVYNDQNNDGKDNNERPCPTCS